MSDDTLKLVCASAIVIGVIYLTCKSKPNPIQVYPTYPHENLSRNRKDITSLQTMYPKTSTNTHHFKTLNQENNLPIACVSTLGGDIMMCPSSGVCPLNGQKCQPQKWPESLPCCTDQYPPNETWYYPNRPPSWLSYK